MKDGLPQIAFALIVLAAGCRIDEGSNEGGGSVSTPLGESGIAKIAVLLNSCLSDDGYLRTTTYLRRTQGGFSMPGLPLACLSSVTNGCEGVYDCYGLSPLRGDETCDSCEGNVAILCDERFRWDCEKLDASCQAGTCVLNNMESCDLSSRSICDAEGRPNDCDDYIHKGPVCSDYGLQCDDSDSSNAQCRGTGQGCDSSDEYEYFDIDPIGDACDGDVLSACVHGAMADLDCTLFEPHFSCQQVGEAFFCGSADACDPKEYQANCQGDQLAICNAGTIERFDCLQLGFIGCTDSRRARCEWEFDF